MAFTSLPAKPSFVVNADTASSFNLNNFVFAPNQIAPSRSSRIAET